MRNHLAALLLFASVVDANALPPPLPPAVHITRVVIPKGEHGLKGVTQGRTPTADELKLLDLTNQARAAAGLPALVWNQSLAAAAQAHSDDLAAHGGNCPDLHNSCDGTFWATRVGTFYPNWYALGENVGENTSDPQALHDGWMASSGHRANILGSFYSEFGAAIVLGQTAFGKIAFGTEDFGSRTPIVGPTPPPGPTPQPTPKPTVKPRPTKTPKRTPRPRISPTRTPRPTNSPRPTRTPNLTVDDVLRMPAATLPPAVSIKRDEVPAE